MEPFWRASRTNIINRNRHNPDRVNINDLGLIRNKRDGVTTSDAVRAVQPMAANPVGEIEANQRIRRALADLNGSNATEYTEGMQGDQYM